MSDIKFEEALQNLEDAVKLLESGSLSLDESISKYEEAMKYIKICNKRLETAEQKVKLLTRGADGVVTDLPFEQYED